MKSFFGTVAVLDLQFCYKMESMAEIFCEMWMAAPVNGKFNEYPSSKYIKRLTKEWSTIKRDTLGWMYYAYNWFLHFIVNFFMLRTLLIQLTLVFSIYFFSLHQVSECMMGESIQPRVLLFPRTWMIDQDFLIFLQISF